LSRRANEISRSARSFQFLYLSFNVPLFYSINHLETTLLYSFLPPLIYSECTKLLDMHVNHAMRSRKPFIIIIIIFIYTRIYIYIYIYISSQVAAINPLMIITDRPIIRHSRLIIYKMRDICIAKTFLILVYLLYSNDQR